MLSDIRKIQDDLICPRCKDPITAAAQACGSCGLKILKTEGKPVLIDFEASVLDREQFEVTAGASVVRRRSRLGVLSWIAKLLHGENTTAKRQIKHLTELVRRLDRRRVLIVGGGTVGSGIADLYAQEDIDIIAFDIYASDNVQFVADAHQIPLRSGSIDAVVIQAVLEHVLDPRGVVNEIERLLCKGGIIYADTPFLQQVHEGPYDFTRFTESGHRYLLRNFGEISAGSVGGPGTQMLWSIEYLCRSIFRSRIAGRIAHHTCFWLRWLDAVVPEKYAVDDASGCYFLGYLAEAPITSREIIKRYRGAQ